MHTRIHASVLLFAFIAVITNGMIQGKTQFTTYFKLRKSEDVLSAAVEKLESENRQLELEINKINESPDYARKVLRDKYHVTEEGERILFFGE